MNQSQLGVLAARVEDVCLNVWPALQEIHFDGWLIRLADGHTRRVNSVNVLRPGTRALDEKIAYCERFYRGHGLPAYFRIVSQTDAALERALEARGYRGEDETRTLFMDFDATPPEPAQRYKVELAEGAPTSEWLSARGYFSAMDRAQMYALEKILKQLVLPSVFACVRDETGAIASIAKGAVHDGIVCLNMVATNPEARRRGYSRDCLNAILTWAQSKAGATGACLQVVAENTPAITLYETMGFATELYRYHYRTKRAAA